MTRWASLPVRAGFRAVEDRHHPVAARASPALTLPARLLAQQRPDTGIGILPAPEEIRPLRYQTAWHPRLDGDPGQRWLRDTVRAVTAEPPEPPPEGTG